MRLHNSLFLFYCLDFKEFKLHIIIVCVTRSVVSNSLWPCGLYLTRLFCPWNSPGKNIFSLPIIIFTLSFENYCRVFILLQVALVVRNSPANSGDAGDAGSIPERDPRKIPCTRSWLPTPVFLTGEFHGQRSLAGYCP